MLIVPVTARSTITVYNGTTYEIVGIDGVGDILEFYIRPNDDRYALEFMYGQPLHNGTPEEIEEAFEIAVGAAYEYIEDYEENVWC